MVQAYVNAYLLEDICKATTKRVAYIETQLSIHELMLQVLEPIKYKTIVEEDNTCATYISSVERPT